MPVEIQCSASGLFAWLRANPGQVRGDIIRRIIRASHKQAFAEWCTRTGRESLGFRFEPGAHRALNLSDRKPPYMKRVRRYFGGRYLPYTSPTRAGRGRTGHMRDLVVRPGSGHRIAARNQPGHVTTVLTLNGARILNRLATRAPEYRSEFLDFGNRGRADAAWIGGRAMALAWQALRKEMERARTRVLREARASARAYAAQLADLVVGAA